MAGNKDFKLDSATHDLVFEDYDLVFIEENERIKQQLKIHLYTFRGEWFLNIGFGVPFIEQILKKPIDVPLISDALKAEIMKVPDVIRITKFESEVDAGARSISINFTVITSYSSSVNLSVSI